METGSTDRKTGVELNLARRVRTVSEGLSFESDGGHKDSVFPGKENVIERKPVAVVGVITPWNFPLHLSMRVVVCR